MNAFLFFVMIFIIQCGVENKKDKDKHFRLRKKTNVCAQYSLGEIITRVRYKDKLSQESCQMEVQEAICGEDGVFSSFTGFYSYESCQLKCGELIVGEKSTRMRYEEAFPLGECKEETQEAVWQENGMLAPYTGSFTSETCHRGCGSLRHGESQCESEERVIKCVDGELESSSSSSYDNEVSLEDPVVFSHKRGFYDDNIDLTLSTDRDDLEIYYTKNTYDEPIIKNCKGELVFQGIKYKSPIAIKGTTVIRAATYKKGSLLNLSVTHSYLFLDDIISLSGKSPTWSNDTAPLYSKHFGMNQDLIGTSQALTDQGTMYSAKQVKESLVDLPSISITTDFFNIFGLQGGIYRNPNKTGKKWEKSCSVELIFPKEKNTEGFSPTSIWKNSKNDILTAQGYWGDLDGFQINAGLRLKGGISRSKKNPKHSLNIFFRRQYGENSLKYRLFGFEGAREFKNISLRTSQNYSWAFDGDNTNTMLRDVFSRDLQGRMGHLYTKSRFYHLYLNGSYWGIFQTQEKVNGNFASSYVEGSLPEDFDVIKTDPFTMHVSSGSFDAYKELLAFANKGFSNDEDYYCAQGLNFFGSLNKNCTRLLDVDNLIDYMLITYFTSDRDGPGTRYYNFLTLNNYIVIFNKDNPDGFKHMEHDSEHSFGLGLGNGINDTMITPLLREKATADRYRQKEYFNGHYLHEILMQQSVPYRSRFSQLIHERFKEGGLLSVDNVISMIEYREKEIEKAIIAESVRWGGTQTENPRTLKDWRNAVQEMKNWARTRYEKYLLPGLKRIGWLD